MPRYTKAQLEEIVYTQLENLNAIHDLIRIIKEQNTLLHKANRRLEDEMDSLRLKSYNTTKRNGKSSF